MPTLADVLNAMESAESGGNQYAVSSKGALGAYQFMPSTAREYGLSNPYDKVQSRVAAERKLTDLLSEYDNDLATAVAAYNAGQGNLKKVGNQWQRIPETRQYVQKVAAMAMKSKNANNDGDWEDISNQYETPNNFAQKNSGQSSLSESNDDGGDWEDISDKYASPENPVVVGQPQSGSTGIGDSIRRGALGASYAVNRAIAAINQFNPLMDDSQKQAMMDRIESEKQWMESQSKAGNYAPAVGKTLAEMAEFVPAGRLASVGARGLATMATGGALTPGDVKERIKGAYESGIGALIGEAGGVTLSKLLRGFTPSKEAQSSMVGGIQPTLGQGIEQGVLGKGIRKAEEASTSLPFLGAITRHSRDRGKGEWAANAMQQAEIPGISAGGKLGYEGISNLRQGFNKAYADALKGQSVPLKPDLTNEIIKIINDPSRYLNPEDRKWAKNFLSKQFSSVPQAGGNIEASSMKDIESNLSAKARSFIGSQDRNQAEIGALLNDLEDAISVYRSQNISAESGSRLKEIDSAYARFKRLQRAASSIGAQEGEFSPAQLLNAVKAMDKSKDKGRFAEGNALMQDIASSGKSVFGSTLGESGTTPRALMAKLALGGGEAAAGYAAGIPTALSLAALMGIGSTRQVQKYLLGGYKTQRSLADLARRITPALSAYGASSGYGD